VLTNLAQRTRHCGRSCFGSKSSGATTTEFVIIMPIFFLILFGIIETAFIFRTRATLNTATFDAARYGAMNHALVAPMNERLVRGMMPLYMDGDTGPPQYAEAYADARSRMTVANNAGLEAIRVVSPTESMVDELGVTRRLQLPGNNFEDDYRVIPNDNLSYRPGGTSIVQIDGESRSINIQDANILKIQTYWCHPLVVPLVGRLIQAVATNFLNPTSEMTACFALSQAQSGNHIPITSQATVRMQSDVVGQELPAE